MKCSPYGVVAWGVAALLSLLLSGCSLFHRSDSGDSTVAASPTSSTGSDATTTTTTVPSVQPSKAQPTPTAPTNAPVPPVVPGYTLGTASPSVLRTFQSVASQYHGVFSGLSVRTVTKGSQQFGTVVLLGLHPELVGNTTVEQRLMPGMVKGMSGVKAGGPARVTTQKVAGLDLAVATTKTTSIVAWYRAGTMVLVLANGGDAAPSITFSKAYIAAK